MSLLGRIQLCKREGRFAETRFKVFKKCLEGFADTTRLGRTNGREQKITRRAGTFAIHLVNNFEKFLNILLKIFQDVRMYRDTARTIHRRKRLVLHFSVGLVILFFKVVDHDLRSFHVRPVDVTFRSGEKEALEALRRESHDWDDFFAFVIPFLEVHGQLAQMQQVHQRPWLPSRIGHQCMRPHRNQSFEIDFFEMDVHVDNRRAHFPGDIVRTQTKIRPAMHFHIAGKDKAAPTKFFDLLFQTGPGSESSSCCATGFL